MRKESLGTITFEEEAQSRSQAQKALDRAKKREHETAAEYEWVEFSDKSLRRVPKNYHG